MIYKLAFLNLWRHRTRSVLSLMIIASAIAAIIVFRGQAHNILEKLRIYGAENQYGHLQIGSQKYWSPDSQKIKEQLFDINSELLKTISSDPRVKVISPRLSAQALLSFSENQFGAKLVGLDPDIEKNFLDSATMVDGNALTNPNAQEIILGIGLQKRLKVKVGDTVSAVSQTVDGVVNAADLNVVGIFRTAVAEVDNQMAFVPIKVVQTLIDSDKVEVWFVRLKSYQDTELLQNRTKELISKMQPELEVKGWRELADFYNRVEEFYKMQNTIIEGILISLTILAILNTVGMTVHERTGEIGTQRALGLQRSDIIKQFTLEGIYLAFFGSILGGIFGAIAIKILNLSGLSIAMPGASENVLIQADFLTSALFVGAGLGFLATLIGTLIPSIRASQVSIVEALRRNI